MKKPIESRLTALESATWRLDPNATTELSGLIAERVAYLLDVPRSDDPIQPQSLEDSWQS